MNKNCMGNLAAVGMALLVAGCGGGDGTGIDGAPSTTRLQPTVITVDGRLLNSCSFSTGCTGNPYAPFTVYNDPQPPAGTTLSGFVRLQVRGIELGNVELLPATGYLPRYGVFRLSRDKTTAWLDLDTRSLPNGPLNVRISAFNVAAGQPNAVELVAMPARIWNINNPPQSTQPFSATLSAAPANGATVSGITRLELRGNGIANAELLPASGYLPRYGQFNISADKTTAWLDFDTRAVPDGLQNVRISAFNVTEGQAGAQEIVVMPARQWNFRNGTDAAFTAWTSTAPANGARVSGRITIEVHGTGLKNVELLPASGYLPLYGRFVTSADGSFAFLDLDTASLPNGLLNVRVSAFNVAPGQAGAKEIIALPARQWNVQN
jgi:hypothetical protein